MKQVRCAICGSASVHGVTAAMMQSQRFPTVFLHGGDCRQRVFHVLCMQMGIDPRLPLVAELIRDDEIMSLLRHEAA